jgi:hypothetical protein
MKSRICRFPIVVMAFGFAVAAQTPQQPQTGSWWRTQAPGMFPYRANAKKLPLISVKGNKFVDPDDPQLTAKWMESPRPSPHVSGIILSQSDERAGTMPACPQL